MTLNTLAKKLGKWGLLVPLDPKVKEAFRIRSNAEGISMSKILAIFATEYATGKIGISFSTVQSQESYDMGKKLSQPDFYTHIASLTPEQRKALWEKEDALYLTPEIISWLEEEIRKIDAGKMELSGPFETASDLKKSLEGNK